MSINIWTDSMQHAALLGKPVLFTNWLIQRDIIPDGWYCYDLRGTHKSPSTRTTLVDHAADYHAGTVLSPIPLKHEGNLPLMEKSIHPVNRASDFPYPHKRRSFLISAIITDS